MQIEATEAPPQASHPPIPSAARLAAWERKQGDTVFQTEAQSKSASPRGPPVVFPPLDQETRTHVETAQAAYYLNRRPQTLRGWACAESYPPALRPLNFNGRLAWPVSGIRAVLGV